MLDWLFDAQLTIAGNVLLFTVFLGAVSDTSQNSNLYGQAGRQVFFVLVSVYGWVAWSRAGRAAGDEGRIVPRWATAAEKAQLAAAALAGTVLCYYLFGMLGAWGGPVDRVADVWIFVGSILATYGMTRGWVDFWVLWLLVDVAGVPLLIRAGYYPSAVLYAIYGGFVVWGLIEWRRVSRQGAPPAGERTETAAAAT